MTNINDYTPFRKGTYQTFSCSENKCTYFGKNPEGKEIRQFQVDGGVFSKGSTPARCDWLFLNDTDSRVYYVELKGSDNPRAIAQIQSTENEIQSSIRQYSVFRRIVYHTGSHKVNGSEAINWKNQGRGANIIKAQKYDEVF